MQKYLAFLVLMFGLAAGSGFPESGFAAVLKVPTEHPTIGGALAAASAGDTVRVAKGVYVEHIILQQGVILEGGWSRDFSRRNIDEFATVLDGSGAKGAVVKGADQAVIDGFTILHGSLLKTADSSEGGGIHCRLTSPLIRNNRIRDNAPSGIFCETSKAVIQGNTITANAQAGIYMAKGSSLKITDNNISENKFSGIGCNKGPDSTFEITGNRIFRNKRGGINAEHGTGLIQNNLIYENGRAGINCVPMPVTIVNNTIDRNGWVGVHVEDPSAVAEIKNNIITHNVDSGIRTNGQGYDHNLLFANGETGPCDPTYLWCIKPQFGGYEDETSYAKKGNIIADPLFVDWAGHDYHLQAGSPAIDAGARKKRFHDVHFPPSLGGKRNDMGCYGGPRAKAEKRTGNRRPLAVPGKDLEAFVGKRVMLDGSGSMDPDGDALTFHWTLVDRPAQSGAVLRRADRKKTAFTPDVPGRYRARLVVTDRLSAASEPRLVTINVRGNRPPEAKIGDTFAEVSVGDTITLFGGGSKDPEGAELFYRWSLNYKPVKSNAALVGSDKEDCSLLIDTDGPYSVQLVVNDGKQDSEPVTVKLSTKFAAPGGKRRVPEEYPTIQSAIDAAMPGDDIIVNGGRYEELLIIDKNVNLIGLNRPVLDGGHPEGDKSTVFIYPLGEGAGKVEGFIITGGGTGEFAHGINVWDSSPDIFNNIITGNNHGMGIHGSPALTGKARIHGNLIYGNNVGIGNGKGSGPHIYNNRIYRNTIIGIGMRGKASPWIDANYIYENRVGIGAREVTSPLIEKNHIFNNYDGIVISPLSTIKRFAGEDILIRNNLVVHNDHLGINITSFNLSKVIISQNTIDSNNVGKRKIRGGGVILGYPQPATFTAVVENNIISNNQVAGLSRYTGPERFPAPGADLRNDHNNFWQNTENCVNCQPGENSVAGAPFFDGQEKDTDDLNRYLQKTPAGEKPGMGYRYNKSDYRDMLPEEDAFSDN